MTRISVKYKPTGEIGSIDDSEFNPQLFEQATAPSSSGGNPIEEIGKRIARPFVDTAKNIGTLGVVGASKALEGINPQLAAQLASTQFANDTSKTIQEDPETAVKKQLLNSAEIASYTIPFGKGAGVMQKAVLPGAAVGGISSANEDNATVDSVVKGAALGGAGAAVIHGLTQLPSILSKGGKAVEKAGDNVRVGKVKLKAGLTGAEDEKAVQDVMKKYSIEGTPQQKYEMLQPTVDKIGEGIKTALANNPKNTSMEVIQHEFQKKIQPAIRQGDITLDEANKAFNEYFQNNVIPVTSDFASGKPSIASVFDLKKDVQASSSQVANAMKKAENKAMLTPKDKIMKALRDSLDEVITVANPEVKQLTLDQSKLYDAIKPIYSQRNTVPTIRAAGFTVPQGAVNVGKDVAGQAMQKVGGAVGSLPAITSSIPEKVGARLPSILPAQNANEPQQNLNTNQNNGSYNNTASDLQHTGSLPQISDPSRQAAISGLLQQGIKDPNQILNYLNYDEQGNKIGDFTLDEVQQGLQQSPQQNYLTGHSPEDIYRAYQKAQAANDKRAMTQLRTQFQDETAYQKSNGGKKALSPTQLKEVSDLQTGINEMSGAEQLVQQNHDLLGPARGTIESNNPYHTKAQIFDASMRAISQQVGRALEGGVLRKEDEEKYRKILPQLTDTPEVALGKIRQVQALLNNQLKTKQSIYNQYDVAPEVSGATLPPIDSSYPQQ